jgi:hypothetical protein
MARLRSPSALSEVEVPNLEIPACRQAGETISKIRMIETA